jgi:hypothetical protein
MERLLQFSEERNDVEITLNCELDDARVIEMQPHGSFIAGEINLRRLCGLERFQ